MRILDTASKQVLVVGRLARSANDSALIVPDGASPAETPRPFVLNRLHRLEESRGTRGRALAGAGMGFAVGAGVGALWGGQAYREPDCGAQVGVCVDFGRGFSVATGALLVGVPLAVAGAGLGQRMKHEVWRPIADRKLRVAIVPTERRGFQFAGSMSF